FLDRANRYLFSTDVVYLRDLYLMNPDSSVSAYVASLERLVTYMDSVDRLYPSHGPSPISPAVITDMAAGMRAVADGREPDEVDEDPILDGGVGAVPTREQIRIHDFCTFRILVSSHAQL
ncbi:MAG: hypothetical protein M3Y37_00145, partial [Chloroflexota bacterium]|nr:hypothetical protein [Chloroflexota bacterium]